MTDDLINPQELGRRLQARRRSARTTQAEIATRLNMSRPTLAAIEAGQRQVTPDLVVRLADAYEVSVGDLVRQGSEPARLVAQFRLPGEPGSDREDLEVAIARLEDLVERYVGLEDLVGARLRPLPPPPYRMPGSAFEAHGETIAEAERRRLGLGDAALVGQRDFLEREVGLRIFSLLLPGRIAGIFGVSPVAGPCVAINSAHPATRQNWTLDHEFGHFLTANGRAEVTQIGGYRRQPESERFAERFAGAWLMPRAGLEYRLRELLVGQTGVSVADLLGLASEYGVSGQALILRLEDLRLIPAGEWDRISATRVDLVEASRLLALPAEARDARPFPRRYVLLALEAYGREAITERDLAKYLDLDRLAVRELLARLSRSPVESDQGIAHVALDLGRAVEVHV